MPFVVRALILAVVSVAVSVAPARAQERVPLAGVVQDSSSSAVHRAIVSLLTAEQALVDTTKTDDSGRFTFPAVAPGRYVLVVSYPGFSEQRLMVTAGPGSTAPQVTLHPQPMTADVTVTASRGLVQDVRTAPQGVTVIDAASIDLRSKAVVAQAVSEEAGLHLLRTSPTMAGIYVRGLTGNKVSMFVDGVRYSTSAMRGGVNTFIDLVEPTGLQAIEVLRGPNSAQYGSDAIGGSVQFLSQVPSFGAGTSSVHGSASLRGGTADQSVGTNASIGYGGGHVALFANIAGRRMDDIRAGGGIDSHAAVTRFLGVSSDRLMPARLPGTGFDQYGGMLKLTWAPTPDQQVVVAYNRNQQDNGKRYDQLLGGDGNLQADLRNLMLDFAYVRYQRIGLGWFDQASLTYSFNTQREERVNQGGNGNAKASITHEFERTTAHGLQAALSKSLGGHDLRIGGELYPEHIKAPSFAYNPVTQVSTTRRGRVPDKASYRSGGIYAQDTWAAVPNRLQLVGTVRYSGAKYESKAADSPLVSGRALWPDDSLSVSTLTFRAGAVWTPGVEGLSLRANVSRGFRAPHVTDLGTVGLTGSGFQVSHTALQGMGATVGTTAGASAASTGRAVEQVKPETSLSYEAGVHYRARGFSTSFSAFVNDVSDNIAYQALILPAGAVGKMLGDQAVTSQNATGTVYVAASSSPVLIRTNFGDARIYGFEHAIDWRVGRRWTVGAVWTYLHAEDTATGLPPNIEGGTPAPDGYLKVRYMQPAGRYWVEPYLHAALKQDRLSTLDLEDRRTGATRTRSSIKNFFYNGATARGWVTAGADGAFGTADDILAVTGERLSQVQARVLGVGVDSAPLVTSIPSYVTVGVRGGVRLHANHEITLDFENIGDENYRGIAWGMDAPGRSLTVAYRARF